MFPCIWRTRFVGRDISATFQYFIIMLFVNILPLSNIFGLSKQPCDNVRWGKAANSYIWETGNTEFWAFLFEKWKDWKFNSIVNMWTCSGKKPEWSEVLHTSSRDDSGGQTGTRWSSQWASPAGRSRCDFPHSASLSSPEAPLLSVAQGSQGFYALLQTRMEL